MREEVIKKLYDFEADPPGSVWSNINASLEEEMNPEFANKIYDAEIPPPATSWNKIVGALGVNTPDEYQNKLYNIEAEPPPGAWKNISSALDEKGRVLSIVKYAVAASLVGVMAFGAYKLLHQKTKDVVGIAKAKPPQKNDSTDNQPGIQKNALAETDPALSNNLPKEGKFTPKASDDGLVKSSRQTGKYIIQTAVPSLATSSASACEFQESSLKGEIPGNCSLVSNSDPYLMFMNPNGYLVRISKKLAETLGCFYTNGNSKEYRQCQKQIKKWGEKIAQTATTTSPDNFMNILDVIKSAQDN